MKTVEQWRGEFKQAFEWWDTISLHDQQTIIYHYCTGKEMSPLEFEMSDIVVCYNNHIHQPL